MNSPIRDALNALGRHAEHVEALVPGGAVPQDSLPRAAAAGLRQASALRAAGEDSWRLHPRLREYLQDHLQMYPAYQSLTDIGARLRTLQALRDEAQQAHAAHDHESLRHQLDEMSNQVYDIADATERNLKYLGGMMSIKYGAVTTLRAKEAQNRWYQRQAGSLAEELNRLGRIVADVEQHADARGWDIARLLRRTIIDALPRWGLRLSDIQAQLSQELYKLREVQENLRNLARADAFIAQHPGWDGVGSMDLAAEKIPPALLRAAPLALRPHPEPFDDDRAVREELARLSQSIPLRPAAAPPPAGRVKREQDPEQEVSEPDPHHLLLRRFAQAVVQAGEPVSVLQWAARAPEARILRSPSPTALPPSAWLLFTVCAMDGRTQRIGSRQVRFQVDEVANDALPGARWSHTFRDALVRVAA